jgi:ABC-2 type transport system ATP-binding protein
VYRSLVLEVRSITKSFGALRALDDVSFTVERGEVVGFLGPNGAGKTTTMRAILGLLAADSGSVTWAGASIDAAVRSRIGYMPAERGLYPSMKVHEHVAYFAALAGLDDDAAEAAATRWLELVGLSERPDTKVQDLSSGNQQRVQLAVALVHEPELLVLDEPFSGLDPVAVASLKEILVSRVDAGVALLFSSHQLDVVEELTRNVVIIDHGRIVLAGDVDELRTGSAMRYVTAMYETAPDRSWSPPGQVLERSLRRVRSRLPAGNDERGVFDAFTAGGRLASFSYAPPALSEVFLDIVDRGEVEGS